MSRPTPTQLVQINAIIEAFTNDDDEHAESLFHDYVRRTGTIAPYRSLSQEPGAYEHVQRLGIWKKLPGSKNVYERDPAMSGDWMSWASHHRIELRPEAKKIVLLGESIARGYFFDPKYNPAIILQHLLDLQPEGLNTQVVDLARSGLSFSDLNDLAAEAAAIQPEAIIIFAGNNWDIFGMSSLDSQARHEMMRMIATGNTAEELMPLTEKIFTSALQDFLGTLKQQFPKAHITIVVPEFNLLDWQSPEEDKIIARMPPEQVSRWMDLRAKAEAAQAAARFDEVETLGAELLKIDETNPLGYEFLAKAAMAKGNMGLARIMLERVKDVAIYGRNFTSKPRCLSVTQQVLKEASNDFGLHAVYLPGIFNRYLEGGLPGRELFMDYCHLTVKGLQLACAAMAKGLIGFFTGRVADAEAVLNACPQPDASTLALAHFFAAIHNAHFGQSDEIVLYHCNKCLESDPNMAVPLLGYARMACMRSSSVVCQDFREMQANGLFQQYLNGMALLHRSNKKILDLMLVDAIVRTLEPSVADVRKYMDTVLLEQHAISEEPEDLLHPFYSLFNFYVSYNRTLPYYRSSFERSVFVVFVRLGHDLELDLTLRSKEAAEVNAEAGIMVNGVLIRKVQAGPNWKQVRFKVSRELLKKGMNEIQVVWPRPGNENIDHESPVSGIDAWWQRQFCSFGDIHSFYARKVETQQEPAGTRVVAEAEVVR
jgi:hypothetical protein